MPERIGFGKRVGAALIDTVIVVILMFTIGPVIGAMFGAGAGLAGGGGVEGAQMAGALGALAGMAIAAPLIAIGYFGVEGLTGWTLGKLALGIQIANADGTAAETSALLTRFAAKNASGIIGLLAAITGIGVLSHLGNIAGLVILVGCFFVLAEARQAFHDMAAGTAVFARDAIGTAPSAPGPE